MTAKRSPTRRRKSQRGKAHLDEMKAKVIAALLLGAGVMEIAQELGLPHSTISTYKAEIPKDKLDEFRRKKGERLDEMVYDLMLANLTALRRQAEVISDPRYIQRQRAGELGTLYGIVADKSVRLLEITTRARTPELRGAGDGEAKSLTP